MLLTEWENALNSPKLFQNVCPTLLWCKHNLSIKQRIVHSTCTWSRCAQAFWLLYRSFCTSFSENLSLICWRKFPLRWTAILALLWAITSLIFAISSCFLLSSFSWPSPPLPERLHLKGKKRRHFSYPSNMTFSKTRYHLCTCSAFDEFDPIFIWQGLFIQTFKNKNFSQLFSIKKLHPKLFELKYIKSAVTGIETFYKTIHKIISARIRTKMLMKSNQCCNK